MMQSLRKNMKIIFWVVALCFVASIFFIYGMKGDISTNPNTLAIVNGKEITVETFENVYRQRMEKLEENFKGEVPEFITQRLKTEVLNSLITQVLISDAIFKYKITVSDDEVTKAFQQAFDINTYKKIAKNPQLTEYYGEAIRHQLKAVKLEEMIKETAKVTENEVKEEFLKRNETRKVKYIKIDPKDYTKNITVSSDDIKNYYEQKINDFKAGDKVKPLETVKSEIENKLKLERALPSAEIEAEKLYKQITDEKSDFETVCKPFGIKETDYFKRAESSLKNIADSSEFIKNSFLISSEGNVGKILKTQNGYYLLKLVSIKNDFTADYLKEKDTLKETLLVKKQHAIFNQWLNNLWKNAKIKDYSDKFFKES